MRNKNYRYPMKLQFFAENADASVEDNTQPESTNVDESGKQSVDDTQKEEEINYQAKLIEAEAKNKKLKADLDNALKKSGELTKQLRAKMTEAEIEAEKVAQEKEEHDAYVAELETFQKRTLAKERYVSQYGTDLTDLKLVAELAEKAADAETKGDMDALSEVNRQYVQAIRKQDKAQFMGSRGRVNMGEGDDSTTMTKEEIFAIKDPKERQMAIARNLKLFD